MITEFRLPDLGDVRVRGTESAGTARLKGDLRMVPFLAKAVRDRQRPLRNDLVVGLGRRSPVGGRAAQRPPSPPPPPGRG